MTLWVLKITDHGEIAVRLPGSIFGVEAASFFAGGKGTNSSWQKAYAEDHGTNIDKSHTVHLGL